MIKILDTLKIKNTHSNVEINTANPFKNKKNKNLLNYLDYFKHVTSIALLPEFVKNYIEYLEERKKKSRTTTTTTIKKC